MRISARNVLAAAALAALAVGASSGLGVREGAPGNPRRRLFYNNSVPCGGPLWPCDPGYDPSWRDSSGGLGFWDVLAPFLEMAMPAIGEQLEICLA